MATWWIELTQPQATLGAAAITFLGAVTAVLIAWALFSAKVRDMRSALTATDELLKQHHANVGKILDDISVKIGGLAESTGQLRADVSDKQAFEDVPIDGNKDDDAPVDPFGDLANGWFQIRDHLEELAANPAIDGRTSAKYARIDRRRYADLINSLAKDNRLQSPTPLYLEAAQLWSRFRPRRKAPTAADAARMVELARLIAPQ